MATQGKVRLSELVQKADPTHNKESNHPIEYEFSNGVKKRGYYKNRGAYNTDNEGEE